MSKIAEKLGKKKRVNYFETPYTFRNAMKEGSSDVKISMAVLGFANIKNKQIAKGLLFLVIELAYLYYMFTNGFHCIAMLPSLGTREAEKVWNEAKGIYEYTAGDNSILILLYGVVTVAITLLFAVFWKSTVCSGYKAEYLKARDMHVNTFVEDVKDLFNKNLHKLLMFLPFTGICVFTILPLIYMITMAFTNYSKEGNHLLLFDWVGFENFARVLNFGGKIGKEFWSVLGWTIIWAVFATGLNYIFGMILGIVINRKGTRFKAFWRFCFVLSIAVPQFVSLLIMRTCLQPQGAINVLLQNAGLTDHALPFLTDATWARVTVIVINCWVGIPYTLLQVTGILQNIPAELYESARVDGANAFITFFKITLPYMLFVTLPYLITQFTGNVNNFNVIFLLSGGAPTPVGSTSGKTDLLVTWLYKLTIDQQYYNLGAVIGILTFVVLAIVALSTYRNTGAYKNEEEFM